MLIIGRNSSCDVCLERYSGEKAPHVIPCGHVFCFDCLSHIRPITCPLCRKPFDPRDPKKLIMDIASAEASPGNATHLSTLGNDPAVEWATQEARRLTIAIGRIITEGSSESHLRALIEETSAFLGARDRSLYPELVISHRTIKYLAEVRTKLRDEQEQTKRLRHSISDLELAKAEAEKRCAEVQFEQENERSVALATEQSLREHCEYLKQQHALISEAVITDWARLNDELKELRLGNPARHSCSALDPTFVLPLRDPNEPISDSSYMEASDNLKVVPESQYYISPLPQFTDSLPSTLESFLPLPEIDYEVDSDSKVLAPPQNPKTSSGDVYCPNSHSCVPSSPSITKPATFHYAARDSASLESFIPALAEPLLSPIPDPILVMPSSVVSQRTVSSAPRGSTLTQIPGGLSQTAPRTSSQSRSRPASRAPTRPSSPLPSTSTSHDTASSREVSQDRNHDMEPLRSRLHDLLNNPTSSSSLPNMSGSHFPTASAHASHDHFSGRREVSRSPSHKELSRPSSAKPHQDLHADVKSASSSSSHPHHALQATRPTVSRASSAAMALENAQRAEKERQRAEKEQQQRAAALSNSHREQTTLSRSSSTSVKASNTISVSSSYNSRDGSSHSGARSISTLFSAPPPRYAGSAATTLASGKGKLTMPTSHASAHGLYV